MRNVCLECGATFERQKPNQRFCAGGKCRSRYHNKEKTIHMKGIDKKSSLRNFFMHFSEVPRSEHADTPYYF